MQSLKAERHLVCIDSLVEITVPPMYCPLEAGTATACKNWVKRLLHKPGFCARNRQIFIALLFSGRDLKKIKETDNQDSHRNVIMGNQFCVLMAYFVHVFLSRCFRCLLKIQTYINRYVYVQHEHLFNLH